MIGSPFIYDILVGEMADTKPVQDMCLGEMLSDVEANDIRDKIQLNQLATPERITALKGAEPMDCIFRVYYRENNRGWVYDDSAYEKIANTILTSPVFVPSCYGHQAQDAVSYEGRKLMGSVIGVLLDKVNGFVYYRIIPDAGDDASDVRRWLKNKQINAVSIWGFPMLMEVSGKTHVIDYNLRSIDFVPPLTEGQKNDGLSIGEMETSFEAKRDAINVALDQKYGNEGSYVWTEETFENYIIARNREEYYKIPYSETASVITLGDAVKVRRVVKYESIQEEVMEVKDMTNDALLAELKARTADGRIAPSKAAGEMGIPIENSVETERLKAESKELADLKAAAGEMGVKGCIDKAKASLDAEKKAQEAKAFGEMVSAVKLEKGLVDKDGKATGEMNALVDKFARLEKGMSREQIAGEMDRVINDDDVKKLVAAHVSGKPAGEMNASSSSSVERFEM